MTEIYVVGFDGNESSRHAVDFAASRARLAGARLHLVHVLEWSPYSFHTPEELAERHKRREEELDRARALLTPVAEELTKSGLDVTYEAHHGHAGDVICKIAEDKGAVQLFIGRTGRSSLTNRLLGGLAMTLAQVAPVPVTIVP